MRTALIGHTGFVGTNLKAAHTFSGLFHRKNISDLAKSEYDLAICAAAPAEMWKANADPTGDRQNIETLFDQLSGLKTKNFVLISTIAVLEDAAKGDEETTDNYELDKAYGKNRRWLETKIGEHFDKTFILRLPALFGDGLKKNFIYDMINPAPSFFKPEAFQKFQTAMDAKEAALVSSAYRFDDAANVFKIDRRALGAGEAETINNICLKYESSSLMFTNSSNEYQFYGLNNLWRDVNRCIEKNIELLHISTEPITAAEVFFSLTGNVFNNDAPAVYKEDMRTRYANEWGEDGSYLYKRNAVLSELETFYSAAKGI